MDEQCCAEWSPATEVIDSTTGDRICTLCGRVLDTCAFLVEVIEPFHGGERPLLDGMMRDERDVRSQNMTASTYKRVTSLMDQLARDMHVSRGTVACAHQILVDSFEEERGGKVSSLHLRVGACMYYGSKMDGCDRSEMEVALALSVTMRELRRSTKRLRELVSCRPYASTMLRGVSPYALVPRVIQTIMTEYAPLAHTPSRHFICRANACLRVAMEERCVAVQLVSMKPMCLAMAVSLDAVLNEVVEPASKKAIVSIAQGLSKLCGASFPSVKLARNVIRDKKKI